MRFSLPKHTDLQAPFITVPAGMPAECLQPIEWLSLDAYVASGGGREGETIYVQADGVSMRDRGIDDRDILVVHVRPVANNGEAVLARLGSEFTIKNFHELDAYERRRRLFLVPANDDYHLRHIEERDDFQIIGVIAYVLKRFQ